MKEVREPKQLAAPKKTKGVEVPKEVGEQEQSAVLKEVGTPNKLATPDGVEASKAVGARSATDDDTTAAGATAVYNDEQPL